MRFLYSLYIFQTDPFWLSVQLVPSDYCSTTLRFSYFLKHSIILFKYWFNPHTHKIDFKLFNYHLKIHFRFCASVSDCVCLFPEETFLLASLSPSSLQFKTLKKVKYNHKPAKNRHFKKKRIHRDLHVFLTSTPAGSSSIPSNPLLCNLLSSLSQINGSNRHGFSENLKFAFSSLNPNFFILNPPLYHIVANCTHNILQTDTLCMFKSA